MAQIFNLRHETGLSEYDSTVTDSGDLSWSRLAAMGGTRGGMRVRIDDTTSIYGQISFTQITSTTYRYRFYIDPNGLTMNDGTGHRLFQLMDSSLLRVMTTLEKAGGTYKIKTYLTNDASGSDATGQYTIADEPHYVEVRVVYASSDVASDATLDMWIDGVLQEQVTGIDLYDLSKPDRLRAGAVQGVDATTSGIYYLDEFVLRGDGTEIGAALPVLVVRKGFTCTVGTNAGTVIAELDVDLRSVTWRLNKTGQISFSISQDDTKATETNLRFGNRVLPNWGGSLDDPEDWDESGGIKCTAYGPGMILVNRRTGKDVQFEGATAGQILTQLMSEANGVRETGIVTGTVWTGGTAHTEAYHKAELLTVLREDMCERLADADFYFSSALSAGQIVFTLNYVQARGESKSGVALLEGHNVTNVRLTKQGPIVNAWWVIGGGSTWGDARAIGYAEDADSIAKYGLREGVETYSEITSKSSLDVIAANRLASTKGPRIRASMDAIDEAPATFASYGVGDTVRCILHDKDFAGYDHMVRVTARQYRPNENVCGLIVEEND
jgi:hypothetical protein